MDKFSIMPTLVNRSFGKHYNQMCVDLRNASEKYETVEINLDAFTCRRQIGQYFTNVLLPVIYDFPDVEYVFGTRDMEINNEFMTHLAKIFKENFIRYTIRRSFIVGGKQKNTRRRAKKNVRSSTKNGEETNV